MFTFILRRILQTIPCFYRGILYLVFSMMHLIPGTQLKLLAGESAPKEQVENIRESLGLNDPLPVQYFTYIGNAIQGDLGNSIRSGREVMDEISYTFLGYSRTCHL